MSLNPWYAVTVLGEPMFWLYLSVVLFLMYFIIRDSASERTRKVLKGFLIILIPSLLISLGLTSIVKNTLQIERPCIPCLEETVECNEFCPLDAGDYSFPSGHAATGFVAYTSIFLAFRRRKYWPVFIIPVLVALSRVGLGVHTVTDIAAGSALAIVVTLLVWKGANKVRKTK